MSKKNMWARASKIAEQTPIERNRYVDLLRAVSISAVVFGHWLMAAPYYEMDALQSQLGSPRIAHLLDVQPWARWLTWLLQVMPVFFFVGGFSNGVSWDGSQRRGQNYSAWLEARMRRLLGPVVPLIFLWMMIATCGYLFAVPVTMIKIASQISLVPVWFLAIYFLIVMLVPVSRAAWRRYGFLSVLAPICLAMLGDIMYFNSSMQWVGWFNYLFVWSAIHQLGYAWQEGRLGGVVPSALISLCGAIMLVLLTVFGPYPISLVGVPSQVLSNTTPPKLPLLALGITQIGLLLMLEKPMRNWLSRSRVWTATVLVNGLIMPIFLWHSTVMMLLIGICFWAMPSLLMALPGTSDWWLYRPAWVGVFMVIMLAMLPIFLLLEKLITANPRDNVSITQLMISAMCMCIGLALLAGSGVTGEGFFGLNWFACSLPIIGGLIAIFKLPKFFKKTNKLP